MVRHGGEVAAMPGICTLVAASEASLRSGLTRSNWRVSAIGGPQAASAAIRSAFFTTSSMPPTM